MRPESAPPVLPWFRCPMAWFPVVLLSSVVIASAVTVWLAIANPDQVLSREAVPEVLIDADDGKDAAHAADRNETP